MSNERPEDSPAEDPVVITPGPNGPLLVRGDVMIAPEPGAEPQKPPRRATRRNAPARTVPVRSSRRVS